MQRLQTPSDVVARCQKVMANAWMVRRFVKHCEEAEEFPELLQLPRTVFDVARALQTRADDPPAYLRMLQKKIGRLRRAAEQFQNDAPAASTHMNFVQAAIAIAFCVEQLEELLQVGLGMLAEDGSPTDQPA